METVILAALFISPDFPEILKQKRMVPKFPGTISKVSKVSKMQTIKQNSRIKIQ